MKYLIYNSLYIATEILQRIESILLPTVNDGITTKYCDVIKHQNKDLFAIPLFENYSYLFTNEEKENAVNLSNDWFIIDNTIHLKKAILYKTFIVVIGENDKTVTKLLTELTEEQVQPLRLLLANLGANTEKVEYTKRTNILAIDDIEQSASELNATPLLDLIESKCIELLNT